MPPVPNLICFWILEFPNRNQRLENEDSEENRKQLAKNQMPILRLDF